MPEFQICWNMVPTKPAPSFSSAAKLSLIWPSWLPTHSGQESGFGHQQLLELGDVARNSPAQIDGLGHQHGNHDDQRDGEDRHERRSG